MAASTLGGYPCMAGRGKKGKSGLRTLQKSGIDWHLVPHSPQTLLAGYPVTRPRHTLQRTWQMRTRIGGIIRASDGQESRSQSCVCVWGGGRAQRAGRDQDHRAGPPCAVDTQIRREGECGLLGNREGNPAEPRSILTKTVTPETGHRVTARSNKKLRCVTGRRLVWRLSGPKTCP